MFDRPPGGEGAGVGIQEMNVTNKSPMMMAPCRRITPE